MKVNHLIAQFVDRFAPAGPAHDVGAGRRRRPPRALYLSSPIGLGHAQRDVAIAAELRARRPDLQIDWLAQHPVTRVLAQHGEQVHPASAWLRNESGHIEHEAGEHDLHAFQAIRRMDEILVHNFMVFDEVVADGDYDLVIGDEAWDVDYFLHENPELKRFSFAWMTDFVGWLPMPDGGPREAALTADYNAEMIEQRARFARVRDRSVFVGDPDDVVEDDFGPGLPSIRTWTRGELRLRRATSPGSTRPRWRAPSGCARRSASGRTRSSAWSRSAAPASGRRCCAASWTSCRWSAELAPELRFAFVTGPRIDPASLPAHDGSTVLGYVPDLFRHLAACDVAVVQGGLTTTMELTALNKPFVYVPLRHHFEQNLHVRAAARPVRGGPAPGLRGRGRPGRARGGDRQGGRPRRAVPARSRRTARRARRRCWRTSSRGSTQGRGRTAHGVADRRGPRRARTAFFDRQRRTCRVDGKIDVRQTVRADGRPRPGPSRSPRAESPTRSSTSSATCRRQAARTSTPSVRAARPSATAGPRTRRPPRRSRRTDPVSRRAGTRARVRT